MKAPKRLDPSWWRRTSRGYEQQDGRAKLIRLRYKAGSKAAGWGLYLDGVYLGGWPLLRDAKSNAAKLTEGIS